MSTVSPDFTMLRLIHSALRRDIAQLRTALGAATLEAGGLYHALWERFAHQLIHHHTLEDRLWWPMLVKRAGDAATDVITEMEDEHGKIDPALAEVSDRFRQHVTAPSKSTLSELMVALERFTQMLESHLRHEESAAIPLAEQYLTAADFCRIEEQGRREVGVRGAKVFLPWVLNGASSDDEAHVLAGMPFPLRFLVRRWQKRDSRPFAVVLNRPA